MSQRDVNRRSAQFEKAGKAEAGPAQTSPQTGGSPLTSGVRIAYAKVAAGSGTTLACYLDKDGDGKEITVYFTISGPAGTHNLNASFAKGLIDGSEVQVFWDAMAAKWRAVGNFADSGPCDT